MLSFVRVGAGSSVLCYFRWRLQLVCAALHELASTPLVNPFIVAVVMCQFIMSTIVVSWLTQSSVCFSVPASNPVSLFFSQFPCLKHVACFWKVSQCSLDWSFCHPHTQILPVDFSVLSVTSLSAHSPLIPSCSPQASDLLPSSASLHSPVMPQPFQTFSVAATL